MATPLSESECVEMGFEKGAFKIIFKIFQKKKYLGLSCISCKELSEFGLKGLQAECNSCCEKSDEDITQYKVVS